MELNQEDGFLVRVIPAKTGLPESGKAESLKEAKQIARQMYRNRQRGGLSYVHIYSESERVFRAQIKNGTLKRLNTYT